MSKQESRKRGRLPASCAVACLLTLAGCGGDGVSGMPEYSLEPVVPVGSPFHGVHGLRFDADDNLFAASVIGQSLFTVDVDTGAVETFIGPPRGMADDIAIAADGTMVWTAIEDGILYMRTPDGEISRRLEGYKGVNGVAFDPAGERLFLTLVFYGDALYEVDLHSDAPPRLISENHGGLNAFEMAADGMIYGPLVMGGAVVRIDPETGRVETVSDEFVSPGALKLESDDTALVLDDGAEIKRVRLSTGETTLVATLPSGGDNLDIDSTGRVFVSLSEDNAILELDAETGETSYAVPPAPLNSPAGFDVSSQGERDTIYLGDLFGGIKVIDAGTGEIGHEAVELFQPSRIAVTDEHVYAVSEVFGTVQSFDRETFDVLDTWEGFSVPGEVLPLANGDLVVADAGSGRVLRVTGPGENDRETLAAGLDSPRGLAAAGNDAVYVTETGAGRLLRLNLDGGVETLATGLRQPEGVVEDANGSVLVVEVGAARLSRIDPADGMRATVVDGLPIGHANGPSLYRDVASGAAGIYFNSDVDNTIYRLVER